MPLYQGIIGGGSSPVEPEDLSPVLLWTNSNPGAAFAAQTVSLDLTEYAGVIIEFNRSSSSDAQTFANRSFIKKGETGLGGGNTVAVTPASRNVSCSNTGVTFEDGYSGTDHNNNAVIPTKIYGVKEYVVDIDLKPSLLACTGAAASGYAMPPAITSSESFENALVIYPNTNSTGTDLHFNTTSLEISVNSSDESFSYEVLQDNSVLLHNPNGAEFTVSYKGRAVGTSILALIKIN